MAREKGQVVKLEKRKPQREKRGRKENEQRSRGVLKPERFVDLETGMRVCGGGRVVWENGVSKKVRKAKMIVRQIPYGRHFDGEDRFKMRNRANTG